MSETMWHMETLQVPIPLLLIGIKILPEEYIKIYLVLRVGGQM